MKKINRKFIIILLLVFGVGFYMFGGETHANTVGQPAPAITLNDLSGTQTAINFDGNVTVINFWATWCPPCRAEMPEMEEFYKNNNGQVNFYAINLQESPDKVREFLNANGYTLPVLSDAGTISRAYRVSAIPTTLIVGRDGVVKFRKSGTMSLSELQQAVDSVK